MIINDLSGNTYELDKGRLTDLGHGGFFILLKHLRAIRTVPDRHLVYTESERETRWVRLRKESCPFNYFGHVAAEHNKIGCRTFSPAVFAKILKAAGVKPARKVRKTNKKAKKVAR